MRCPSCQATDNQAWLDRFPSPVAKDLSIFIDCNPIFASPGIICCSSCGCYFPSSVFSSGDAVPLAPATLPALLKPDLCPGFEAVLAFPPDLVRVAANELALGNQTSAVCETASQVVVLVLRYRFLDSHIASSWIDGGEPESGRWHAWYCCSSTRQAVACEDSLPDSMADRLPE